MERAVIKHTLSVQQTYRESNLMPHKCKVKHGGHYTCTMLVLLFLLIDNDLPLEASAVMTDFRF